MNTTLRKVINGEPLQFTAATQNYDFVYVSDVAKAFYLIAKNGKQKNISMLISAFSKVCEAHKEYSMEIYGDGSESDELEKEIKNNGLEKRIYLKGFVRDIQKYICNASIYACSSNYEGLSNALLEAMALGLAVVTTDSSGGGARSVIQSYKNGILVPVNSVDEMSNALDFLMSDEKKREELGREAAKIKILLSESVICDQWENMML